MSVRLSHTWFPIWGMKWDVCPSVIRDFQYEKWNVSVSVIRGFQYEGWKEMSVRLSHTWFPIWGMKWDVCPSVIRDFQYEKWNVSVSVIRSFQYEEWNEMYICLLYVVSNMRNEMKCMSVCHTWFPIWGMKWNVCPSQSFVVFQYEEWNEMYICLSYVVSIMRNEMKRCLSVSVIRGFQYEEWNEMLSVRLSHTWFPIWGMKCLSVCQTWKWL